MINGKTYRLRKCSDSRFVRERFSPDRIYRHDPRSLRHQRDGRRRKQHSYPGDIAAYRSAFPKQGLPSIAVRMLPRAFKKCQGVRFLARPRMRRTDAGSRAIEVSPAPYLG